MKKTFGLLLIAFCLVITATAQRPRIYKERPKAQTEQFIFNLGSRVYSFPIGKNRTVTALVNDGLGSFSFTISLDDGDGFTFNAPKRHLLLTGQYREDIIGTFAPKRHTQTTAWVAKWDDDVQESYRTKLNGELEWLAKHFVVKTLGNPHKRIYVTESAEALIKRNGVRVTENEIYIPHLGYAENLENYEGAVFVSAAMLKCGGVTMKGKRLLLRYNERDEEQRSYVVKEDGLSKVCRPKEKVTDTWYSEYEKSGNGRLRIFTPNPPVKSDTRLRWYVPKESDKL